ncbi:MAG: PIG-L family deacetylase, partial [Acidimicrobiales bacterium]
TSLPALVCVHAHPDDETFFGAGATSLYAELGHRVVLVTCTRGQLGFDQHGRVGNDPAHDEEMTSAQRALELQRAAASLGFARVVTLGYDDSGMKGWSQNDRPNAFMRADVDAVARTLGSIFDEEHAAVVVTYDENGFYGHPDHIQANVVTRRALALSSSVERLYYSVLPRGVLTNSVRGANESGLSLPAWVLDASTSVDNELVATTLDVRDYLQRKRTAMALHASQIDNADLIAMGDELFAEFFGTEYYQRAWSRRETSGDQADLFGGL